MDYASSITAHPNLSIRLTTRNEYGHPITLAMGALTQLIKFNFLPSMLGVWLCLTGKNPSLCRFQQLELRKSRIHPRFGG